MADLLSKDQFVEFLRKQGLRPVAQDRYYRSPIYIDSSNYDNTEDEGIFRHEDASIRIKKNNPSTVDLLESIKHELVHHIMQGSYPSYSDYQNKFTSNSPHFIDFMKAMISNPLSGESYDDKFGGPSNLFNFNKWGRAGEATQELPSYMTVYNPEQTKVGLTQRNLYMQDLYKYLDEIGQPQKGKLLKKLVESRNYDVIPEGK